MLTKNITKLPKSLVDVQITVPWSDLEMKWNETLQRLSSDVEIPGFRKGSAPIDMVEPKISQQLQQELLKQVMPQALIDALQGTDVVPIEYPQYQVISFQKGSDLVFKAQITEKPEVKLGSYKDIHVKKPELKLVTDDEINKVIEDLYKRWKARFPMGQPQNQPTSNPSSSNSSALPPNQGGSLNFTNNSPKSPNLPPNLNSQSDTPDDNFAKSLGAQDLTDLKTKIREDLEAEAKFNNQMDFEEDILQEVEKMTVVEIPEILIQDDLNRMLVSLQRRVTDTGLLFDDYLKSQNKTLDSLKSEWRVQAEKNVRMELGLAEIAKLEKVDISDTELQAEIDKVTDPKVKQQFNYQEPRMQLRHALRQTKTLDLLKSLVQQPA